MSKKKKKRINFGGGIDTHHIFFTKLSWDEPYAHKLRTHWYCIVEIPKKTWHHAIHEKVRYVPVPKKGSILTALGELTLLEDYGAIRPDDPIEKRLKLLANLFAGTDKPTADALEKQLEVVNSFKEPP